MYNQHPFIEETYCNHTIIWLAVHTRNNLLTFNIYQNPFKRNNSYILTILENRRKSKQDDKQQQFSIWPTRSESNERKTMDSMMASNERTGI